MSISSILNIAKNALYASQACVQVTSNNVANVNTEGYTRQAAILTEETSSLSGSLLLGNGVEVSSIKRYSDKYLDQQISEKSTELEEQNVYETYYTRIESLLNEDSTNLTENITDFFNSWQELSADPQSAAIREEIASRAQSLCSTINNIYDALKDIQVELNNNVMQQVEEINGITASIAELNSEIFKYSAGSSHANELLDKRTEYIKELSGKIGITCIEGDNGQVTILASAGKLLVEGNGSWNLAVENDYETGFYGVSWEDASGDLTDITDNLGGGSLYGMIKMRDEGVTEFTGNIDEIAETLITEINNIHKEGYSLNHPSSSSDPDGIAFFKELTGNYARDLSLSDAIEADTGNIAAAAEADSDGEPAGNGVALDIASLVDGTLFKNDTMTIVDYTSYITSRIGELSSSAAGSAEYSQDTMDSLEAQRESISGVSLDEEMTNLVKYQYAYQAASRLLTIADELFQSLLEVAR